MTFTREQAVDKLREVNVVELDHQATPSENPESGKVFLYIKSDDKLYKKVSGGTETEIGAAGANTALSNLTTTSVNQDLLPSTDNARDLGSASARWNDLFITGLNNDGSAAIAVNDPLNMQTNALQNVRTTKDSNNYDGDGASQTYVDELASTVRKYTVTHTSLQAAALTNDIELFSLAAREYVESICIKHSTAFSGGSISAYTISVGLTGNLDYYQSAFDVFQATGNTVFAKTLHGLDPQNFGSATSIRIAATSVGANLSASTAGSVTVYVKVGKLPA